MTDRAPRLAMDEQLPRRQGRRSRSEAGRGAPSSRDSSPYVRELPFLLVLGGVGIGLAVVALYNFKYGSILMGAALVAGGVLRAVLSEHRAGLLVVRGRILDAVTMTGLGVLIAVAAVVVPPP